MGDNDHGKGSKRGGDVHNNDGRIEEGEEQQLLNDSLSLLHHSWPYSQQQQQQHRAKMMGRQSLFGMVNTNINNNININVNTPTAAPVTSLADYQHRILANALRVLRARSDMGLLPISAKKGKRRDCQAAVLLILDQSLVPFYVDLAIGVHWMYKNMSGEDKKEPLDPLRMNTFSQVGNGFCRG